MRYVYIAKNKDHQILGVYSTAKKAEKQFDDNIQLLHITYCIADSNKKRLHNEIRVANNNYHTIGWISKYPVL